MYGILDKETNIKYYGHDTIDSANEVANVFKRIDSGEFFGLKPTDDVNCDDRYEVFEYTDDGQDMGWYILDLKTGKRYEAPRFANPHIFMQELEDQDSNIYYKTKNLYRNRYRVVYG